MKGNKMKSILKLSIFIVLIFFLSTSLLAQAPNLMWANTYGGSNKEVSRYVQQTSDGGYIIVGLTGTYGSGDQDVWLIKTDSMGNTVWTQTYGGVSRDRGFCGQQTFDGGYIIGARTASYGAGDWDFWLIKTDSIGNTQWTRTFGGIEKDGFEYVRQTTDGGFILIGGTESYGAGDEDCWLIKTDANGNITWSKTYGGQFDDGADCVQQTIDGGFIIIGFTGSYGNGDVWLIKTDAMGDTMWTKTFGGSLGDMGRHVQQTEDGGYILTCRTEIDTIGNLDGWIIKTDSLGNMLWNKTYGGLGEDELRCSQETYDGGYITSGWYTQQVGIDSDIWLIKSNEVGDTLWTKTFGGSSYEEGYAVQQTSDSGYIVAGFTGSYGAGDDDIWLLKIEPDTHMTTLPEIEAANPIDFILHQNYPNPFNPSTTIKYTLPKSEKVKIEVFNLLGQSIKTLLNNQMPSGSHEVEFNGQNLSSGIYYYKIEAGDPSTGSGQGYQEVRKMILLR
jgi:hypothetical protein